MSTEETFEELLTEIQDLLPESPTNEEPATGIQELLPDSL